MTNFTNCDLQNTSYKDVGAPKTTKNQRYQLTGSSSSTGVPKILPTEDLSSSDIAVVNDYRPKSQVANALVKRMNKTAVGRQVNA